MSKYLKDGTLSENEIQKTIVKWAKLHPVVWNSLIHCANEGKRSKQYGRHLKDMGMRRGVADLFIALPRRGFCGAWIELKSENGKLTKEQQLFLSDMKNHGYYTDVCNSIDLCIKVLSWYCLD